MQAKKVDRSKLPLFGKAFVITGTLSRPRPEVEEEIKSLGGEIHSAVSKKTDYVIVGTEPGSKYAKARELGVKIISEAEYGQLIK